MKPDCVGLLLFLTVTVAVSDVTLCAKGNPTLGFTFNLSRPSQYRVLKRFLLF